MIAEAPASTEPENQVELPLSAAQAVEPSSLSVGRVVASLQVLLAIRRAARHADEAYWYTIARGM